MDKVNWNSLSCNPEIFVLSYDYEKMKSSMLNSGIADELLMRVCHPARIESLSRIFDVEIRELIQIYK